ncbi:unnamed protein product [Urochloa decumbens]|uniref:TF-B3 domain-containing protein n=1 Tax=Urochloa decumbens TaxID=240449 RepID=A0ABC9GDN0_9POAL
MDKRRFFVVMLDKDFKSRLIIPKKFAKNVGGQISDRIKLKARDGETYDIEVSKEHNELLLQSGWEAFANAYELGQGDTLVFGYSGDSHFEVQIFSPSTCEKELSCFPITSIPCVQESITSHDSHLQSPGSERMNKACTICTDCVANHYWHHMGNKDRCFIKVMMSVSNFKEKLTIPKRFVTNVGGQIPEEVQLEVPNGKTYNIKIAREHDALVMGSGWANFASAYDLKQGDFLVFTYSGKSHFKVRMFDPRFVPSSRSPMHGVSEPGYIVPRFTVLNDQQKHKVEDKVRAIGSPYHIFVLIAQTSNIIGKSCSMAFCSAYAKKYLQRGSDTMSLLHPQNSKKWEAEIEINNNRHKLGQGWRQFVSDNKLKVGDICLFQLMETKKLTMIVHIIPKQECT